MAENGEFLCRHEFDITCYPELKNTVILPRGLDSHSFEIKAGFERGYVTANAIEMPEGGIVTRLVKAGLKSATALYAVIQKPIFCPYSLWSVLAGAVR